jgi:predicted HAD superfamily Cof-like phosphohydrolase
VREHNESLLRACVNSIEQSRPEHARALLRDVASAIKQVLDSDDTPDDWVAMVEEFHIAFDIPSAPVPTLDIPFDRQRLRKNLADEEVGEFKDAVDEGDLEGIADACGDRIYIAIGDALTFGVDLRPIFAEIHRTNMAKLHDGKPVHRFDGKIVKPEGWKGPDIRRLLKEQGR